MTTARNNARTVADIPEPDEGQSRLEAWCDRLVGTELEREIHANIVNIASRELGLNRVRILQSKIVARSPEFQDAMTTPKSRTALPTFRAATWSGRTSSWQRAAKAAERQCTW